MDFPTKKINISIESDRNDDIPDQSASTGSLADFHSSDIIQGSNIDDKSLLDDSVYKTENAMFFEGIESKVKVDPNEDFKTGIEWNKVVTAENFSAKVIEITDETVKLEVLTDSVNKVFEERIFDRKLFEDITPFKNGKYIYIRYLSRPGKAEILISDGDKIAKKKYFEDYSEFDFIDDIPPTTNTLTKLD
ncbi:MAG: hypothetical protein JXR11_11085 [Balneola sp.]